MANATSVRYENHVVSQRLCPCMLVTEEEVIAVIRAGARTVDDVGERCEAGTGCGSCRGGIAVLLEEEERRRQRRPVPDAILKQLQLFDGVE